MTQLPMVTADFGEPESVCPICSGSTEEAARRRGRIEYRCLVCSLEFDVLAPTAAPAPENEKGCPRQGSPPVDRKPSLSQTALGYGGSIREQ
jgi:transposase-like protein